MSRLGPAALGVALFVLYVVTLCPTVGPGDSGELTVALATWGIPHAPGYPLLALVGNVVSHVAPGPEPALVLNLMNAAFAAAACGVLAAATGLAANSAGAGIVAGLALGTSRVFWLHALALEVFSLNALFAALLLWLLGRALTARRAGQRAAWPLVPGAVLVSTTAVTHHLTLVLLAAPVVAAVAWLALRGADAAVWRRALVASAAALIAGLLPLLYLPLAARGEPPLAWGDPRTLRDVIALLARRDFGGGTLMSPAIVVDQVLTHGESASPLGQRNLLAFWADVPRSFGIVFPALALLGLGWSVRRWRLRPLAFAGLACLALVTLFFMRVNTPRLPLYAGVTERFYILPHIVLALFTGCGAARLAEIAERARLPRAAALTVAALLTGVAMLPVNARPVSQRGNTFTRDFGLNLLAGVPEHARYFASGDLFHNSVLYAQHGLHRRRDVSVIEQDLVAFPWYARQLRRRGTLRLPERSSVDSTTSATWLELNAGDGRPAAAVKFIDDTYRARWELVPRGIVSVAHSRAETYDIAARERALTDVVRTFDLTSLERRYQPESWEISEGVFYAYAVGVLRGMRDVAGVTGTKVDWTPVAAIAKANKWSGRLAAEYRAQRADFIRQSLEEPRLHLTPDMSRRLATVAVLAAESALEQDRRNLQALRTLAQLMAERAELSNPLEELRLRQRIVDQRPGDVDELIPYFALVARIQANSTLHDPEISRRAADVRARTLRLFAICDRIEPGAGFMDMAQRGLPMLDGAPAR